MKKLMAVILTMVLLSGCAAVQAPEPLPTAAEPVDVIGVYSQLEAVGLPSMLDMAADMQLNIYGIRAEDVKQSKVVVCTDGLRADEIWLIEAVDEAAAAKIKGLAESRIKQKDAESITYSPEQNVIVKKSVVETVGRYVYFICSPDVDALVSVAQTAFGK